MQVNEIALAEGVLLNMVVPATGAASELSGPTVVVATERGETRVGIPASAAHDKWSQAAGAWGHQYEDHRRQHRYRSTPCQNRGATLSAHRHTGSSRFVLALPTPAELPGATGIMTAGLSRWFGQPKLDATGLRWARPANHIQHGVARNGLLYMTEDAMGFEPKRIDAVFGARAGSWSLSSITNVQLTPTLRKLRVTITTDTGRQRFLVSDAFVVYNDLRSWQPG